ncbi:MAG: hypothetical protein KH828_00320 [Clostridiales bacterium]|nr:hypothetical protein [Clostridiales bacterium]
MKKGINGKRMKSRKRLAAQFMGILLLGSAVPVFAAQTRHSGQAWEEQAPSEDSAFTFLTVKRDTAGESADKLSKSGMAITFSKSWAAEGDSFQSGSKIYEYGKDYCFELGEGESLTFGGVPVGTGYRVTESRSLSAAKKGEWKVAGEGDNTVIFPDTFDGMETAGFIGDNRSLVLMILAVVGGFTGYIVTGEHRVAGWVEP